MCELLDASLGAGDARAPLLRLTLRETLPISPGDRDLPDGNIPRAGLTVPGKWSGSPLAPDVRSDKGSTRKGCEVKISLYDTNEIR